jgi:secondary thiamine-phosphate synthase enzyme
MAWLQRDIRLSPRARGCHLITRDITEALPELKDCQQGLLHLFLQHTSASLSLNENADPDVRDDLEMALSRLVPEDWPYRHTTEGPDDMPAHVKGALIGFDVRIPVQNGRLILGTWQGIYLWEHRDEAPSRRVFATLMQP